MNQLDNSDRDQRLVSDQFPRSSAYHPDWVMANAMGSNSMWLAEWLSTVMELQPGMRVLDLGCGRAVSSVFLAREFDVQVWATDLWISASENIQRIRDAGCLDRVFPLHADAIAAIRGGLLRRDHCDRFVFLLRHRRSVLELPRQLRQTGRPDRNRWSWDYAGTRSRS